VNSVVVNLEERRPTEYTEHTEFFNGPQKNAVELQHAEKQGFMFSLWGDFKVCARRSGFGAENLSSRKVDLASGE
jgi:hypothetical protein